LVDLGIVDPNAKFDEGTQERIGTHLIMNDLAGGKGLSDLKSGDMTQEEFETALGKQFEGIERGLDKGAGSTALTIGAASETGRRVEEDRRVENVQNIKEQVSGDAEPSGVENFFYNVIGNLGFGLGKPLADKLRNESKESRQAIMDQHLYALENGATPKLDEDGNYIGFDISTMDTFADKMLAAEDIMAFMPPSTKASSFTVTQDMIDSLRASGLNAQADALTVGQTLNLPAYSNLAYQADADGDGVPDSERFSQVYEAQKVAAEQDPYGYSTEQGFITEDGREFFVDASGDVIEVEDSTVPYEVRGGTDVENIFTDSTIDGYGSDNPCPEGFILDPETQTCVPIEEVIGGVGGGSGSESDTGVPTIGIGTGVPARSFEEILQSIVVPAPDIPSISTNIRPMQAGGMVGLNRAADNFIKALAG